MLQKVKQTVYIYYKGAGTAVGGFTFNISNVAFQPDTLIVKSIEFVDGGTGTEHVVLLYSDLVGNRPLLSFANANASYFIKTKDVYHPFNVILQGTFTFNYIEVNNTQVSLDGDICIELEFSKNWY